MISLRQYQQSCKLSDLTIISVSFATSEILKENIKLMREFNPEARFWWLVVDNDFTIEADWLDDDRVVVIPGTYLTEEEFDSIAYGSLQHAKSLDIALAYVRTDKFLILDPDCFLVKRNSIQAMLENMAANDLVFWGTPYHPTRLGRFTVWGRTYHYFPTAICMLVDHKKLQRNHGFFLDFTPSSPVGLYSKKDSLAGVSGSKSWRRWTRAILKTFKTAGLRAPFYILKAIPSKWAPDRREDIGYQVYKRYHRVCRHDCTTLYFDRKFPALFSLWKHFVPQWMTGYPKRPGFWVRDPMPFVPKEYPGEGRWEQFFFKGEPFAVHVGKVSYLNGVTMEQINKVIRAVRETNGA